MLVIKNRLGGLLIETYDQIGQGGINNPNKGGHFSTFVVELEDLWLDLCRMADYNSGYPKIFVVGSYM